MKKKLLALLLMALLVLSLSATAFAETITGAGDWYVEFNSKQKMESHFPAITDLLRNVQPGDEAIVTVAVKNTSGKTVDWYMLNNIIQTLEESHSAANGGYSYILNYKTSSGSTRELYNSNKVGGGGEDYAHHDYTNSTAEGLKEIQDALKDYMFLERMDSGKSGMVELKVALDGESQDNSYQDALAKLQLQFAVEVVPTNVVVTGDDPVKLSPMYIGMGVSGVVVLLLAIDGAVRNARKRKEPKA